ncbi:hypothetical protein SCHPADRAFT_44920 [Schizopora paradoxa]|uniref:Uncharacterized protein n=1 Tax=Schizopora paradoxa TaxID=27342 RepID=A0A0H2S6K8_9AGAM|nr:hypothetical protein SCHPADRAFT_44920 [Schizopora paradoxa]
MPLPTPQGLEHSAYPHQPATNTCTMALSTLRKAKTWMQKHLRKSNAIDSHGGELAPITSRISSGQAETSAIQQSLDTNAGLDERQESQVRDGPESTSTGELPQALSSTPVDTSYIHPPSRVHERGNVTKAYSPMPTETFTSSSKEPRNLPNAVSGSTSKTTKVTRSTVAGPLVPSECTFVTI